MSDDFLSRWSRLKREARKAPEDAAQAPRPPEAAPMPAAAPPGPPEPVPLPPIESLTPESDFAPFMQGKVDPALRSQALKTLFSDPRYNVMDGLDTYIADYSIADPLPDGWLEQMHQYSRLGDFAAREVERLAQLEAPQGEAVPPATPLNVNELPDEIAAPQQDSATPDSIEGMPTRTG